MHWIIDIILICVTAYLVWAIDTARGQIAALAVMLDGYARNQRDRLDSIGEVTDSMARQLNTPGTRHWTAPEDPY